MELVKRKYAKSEVEEMLAAVKREYEEKLSAQKARISELVHENSVCRVELDSYIKKDRQISAALKHAEKYSAELEHKADMRYELAVETVSSFLLKWNAYFDHLKEKYPMYPVVADAVKLRDKIVKIVGKKDAKTVIYTADKSLSGLKSTKNTAFSPKEKIADYIAATEAGDNGFNMDEVLNPGALRLEDLCKELGLLTENDL